MLTRQGAIATAVSVALVIAGRLFGIFELFLVGAGGAALVIGALAVTSLTRVRLDVSRDLRPPRIHAGELSTVTLLVTNGGRRRTPVLQLRDAVGPGRTASVVLSPLAPAEQVTAAYTLPSEHRGRIHVGPLEVRISDPFGLAALSAPAVPTAELVVWPAVEAVLAPAPGLGRDHDLTTPAALAPSGEELYAMRPYVDGDDLRRVHWRASAKRDDLVVRQDERPGQGQATVVLDTRTGAYRGDTFERAVSAAASIVVAAARHGLALRLVTAAGHDSGPVGPRAGLHHVDAILDHLAVAERRDVGDLGTVVSIMERSGQGPAARVVVLTGDGHDGERNLERTTAGGPGAATRVVFTTHPAGERPLGGRPSLLVVGPTSSFASVWNAAATGPGPFVRA